MTLRQPLFLQQAGDYIAANDDRLVAAALAGRATGVPSLATDFLPTETGPASLGVQFAAGAAYVDAGPAVGGYWVLNDGAVTVPIDPGDATYPRIDRLGVGISDGEFGGLDNADWYIYRGTPAASPAPPALPADLVWIELAQVTVPAAASSVVNANIADLRGSLFGLTSTYLVFRNAAARDAALPAPVSGQKVYLQDSNVEQVYVTGTGWITTWVASATRPMVQGWYSYIGSLNGGSSKTGTVTYNPAYVGSQSPRTGFSALSTGGSANWTDHCGITKYSDGQTGFSWSMANMAASGQNAGNAGWMGLAQGTGPAGPSPAVTPAEIIEGGVGPQDWLLDATCVCDQPVDHPGIVTGGEEYAAWMAELERIFKTGEPRPVWADWRRDKHFD